MEKEISIQLAATRSDYSSVKQVDDPHLQVVVYQGHVSKVSMTLVRSENWDVPPSAQGRCRMPSTSQAPFSA